MFKETVSKTGFLVSLISYFFFWILDLLSPGFVSRFFSVHIFLLGILFFGVWWASVMQAFVDRQKWQIFVALVASFFGSIFAWNVLKDFGLSRTIGTLLFFCVPFLILRLIRYK